MPSDIADRITTVRERMLGEDASKRKVLPRTPPKPRAAPKANIVVPPLRSPASLTIKEKRTMREKRQLEAQREIEIVT